MSCITGDNTVIKAAIDYGTKIGEFDENRNLTRAGKLNLLIKVAKIATLAIACATVAGCMSASATGWSLIGLGGGMMALSLLGGKLKDRRSDLIIKTMMSAFVTTMGVLSVAGVYPGVLIGCLIISGIAMNLITYLSLIADEIHKINNQEIAHDISVSA